jgi:hypothetical protein
MALQEVGCLWRKTGKNGDYLTGRLSCGVLGMINIAIFQNEVSPDDGDNKPSARICIFTDDHKGS